MRQTYGAYFEIAPAKIHPHDLPPVLHEYDTGPLVKSIENEFGVKFDDAELERLTGDFDTLVKYVARKTSRSV